ncbi:MAG: glycosyltransferase [Bacteroidales bacterium]|nr:glycosyltransferase [Bacteroidales bacterium]
MKRICHITTVHTRYDVRIFHKECKSLSKYYKVYLIVADGLGDEVKEEINIIDIGLRQSSRLKRARVDSAKALKKAKELDCDLYHFHDFELIKTGVKLKKKGKKVIYDAHEDLPRQIYGKPYLKEFLKPVISKIIEWQENKASKKFSYICTATPYIRNRFLNINKNTIDINNYPIIGELLKNTGKKSNNFCYTGGITSVRGIINIVKAMKDIESLLILAGPSGKSSYMSEMKNLDEWKKVNYLGLVDRTELGEIMSSSLAGIVTFLPFPNHVNAQPNKIFEYMSAGIPIIASNFQLWKDIIEKNNCGICVNPENSKEISKAMQYMKDNLEKVKQMGKNGQKMIKEKYNWNIEEKKLFNVYKKVLND